MHTHLWNDEIVKLIERISTSQQWIKNELYWVCYLFWKYCDFQIVKLQSRNFDVFQKFLLNSMFLSIFNSRFQSKNISLHFETNTNIKTIWIYTVVVQFAHQTSITKNFLSWNSNYKANQAHFNVSTMTKIVSLSKKLWFL